jgi:hypothetical protein
MLVIQTSKSVVHDIMAVDVDYLLKFASDPELQLRVSCTSLRKLELLRDTNFSLAKDRPREEGHDKT